ncbi:uncharacterized protein LOC131253799 [Magnolia sinica]|uniref:uncharacterized protein LOC131253799 n=1 Tax=Magnolia sinica TaxID=86752 RepID=UPI0026586928|nr:uncharacterized protein LOC131253799 [Magnolia sinica]
MRGRLRFQDPSMRIVKSRKGIRKPATVDPKSLFVGNLSFSISFADLIQIFQKYGRVSEVFLPCFPGTSKPGGYGFVRFMYEDNARAAKGVLDGQKIDGRQVSVKDTRPKPFLQPDAKREPIRKDEILRDRGQIIHNVKGTGPIDIEVGKSPKAFHLINARQGLIDGCTSVYRQLNLAMDLSPYKLALNEGGLKPKGEQRALENEQPFREGVPAEDSFALKSKLAAQLERLQQMELRAAFSGNVSNG